MPGKPEGEFLILLFCWILMPRYLVWNYGMKFIYETKLYPEASSKLHMMKTLLLHLFPCLYLPSYNVQCKFSYLLSGFDDCLPLTAEASLNYSLQICFRKCLASFCCLTLLRKISFLFPGFSHTYLD